MAQSAPLLIPLPAVLAALGALLALVGGLIASGEITDPYELNFLQEKIRVLEEKMTKIRQDVDN